MTEKKKITEEDVMYVAGLSRIHLESEEAKQFTSELENILEYVTKLEKLDVSNVAPTSHVLSLENVYREDTIKKLLTHDEALSIAVESDKGCFKVPKIIE